MSVILSYIQARPLLKAREQNQATALTSPDLGISTILVTLSPEGVNFVTGESLDWTSLEKISQSEGNCYLISDKRMQAIQIFSQETNRSCSLIPTRGAPSMLIAGFVMHRLKEIDPWQHAQRMVAAIAPVNGSVLDTTTGLGYTGILATRSASDVTTIELDPGVQTIAQLNPWSRDLFNNPKITQIMGDAYEVVPTFANARFDRIIHDPPTLKLAGSLYSGAFYHELYRILKRGGRLFHYIGDLESRGGNSVMHGVMRRLQEAGFSRVARRPNAYGVIAYK